MSGRVYKELIDGRNTLSTLAGNVGSGYHAAFELMKQIDAGLNRTLLTDLDTDDVHSIAVEFEVDAGLAEVPFDGLSGTIGLSIIWCLELPSSGGPVSIEPAIRCFAKDSNSGPEVYTPNPPDHGLGSGEVEGKGALFVSHRDVPPKQDEEDGENGSDGIDCPDSWFRSSESDSAAAGNSGLIFVGNESLHVPISEGGPGELMMADGAWYCFGATLEVTGDDTSLTFEWTNGRYSNYRWLLWRLGLAAQVQGLETKISHNYSFKTKGGYVIKVPDWSPLSRENGAFVIADNCWKYTPASESTVVIDGLEYHLTEQLGPDRPSVTNWADSSNIYHFTDEAPPPDPPGNNVLDCRSLSNVTQFVLHETDSGSPWTYSDIKTELAEDEEKLGIHLSIHQDGGSLQVHNDLLDQLNQAEDLNETSFGVEIVNDTEPTSSTPEHRKVPNAPFLGGDTYVRPTHNQLESTAYLVDWFRSVDRHGLAVDSSFIGYEDGVASGGTKDGFCVHSNMTVSGHATTSDSGIWAHSYHSPKSKHDGIFPGLYAWLRLEARLASAGPGLSKDYALKHAEKLVNADNGHVFTASSGEIFVDVSDYTIP